MPDTLPDDTAPAFRIRSRNRHHRGMYACRNLQHHEQVRKVCGDSRVAATVGGMHLLNPWPQRLRKTGEYLRKVRPGTLYACHRTSPGVKIALRNTARCRKPALGHRRSGKSHRR